jgi:hypothetical protein
MEHGMRINAICRVRNNKVKLPLELAAVAGMKPNAEVSFHVFRNDNLLKIIASSFYPTDWHNVYEIKFVFPDRPDCLATVCALLKQWRIKILWSTAVTSVPGRDAEWDAIVDFGYSIIHQETDKIKALQKIIENEVEIDRLAEKTNDLWRKIVRVGEKYVSGREIGRLDDPGIDWQETKLPHHDQRQTLSPQMELELPASIIRILNEILHSKVRTTVAVADDDMKSIYLSFYPPEARLVEMDFLLNDHPDVLPGIIEYLGGKGMNIIRSESDILVSNETMRWSAIVDLSMTPHEISDFSKLKITLNKELKILCQTAKVLCVKEMKVKRFWRPTLSEIWQDFRHPSNWSARGYLAVTIFVVCVLFLVMTTLYPNIFPNWFDALALGLAVLSIILQIREFILVEV